MVTTDNNGIDVAYTETSETLPASYGCLVY